MANPNIFFPAGEYFTTTNEINTNARQSTIEDQQARIPARGYIRFGIDMSHLADQYESQAETYHRLTNFPPTP